MASTRTADRYRWNRKRSSPWASGAIATTIVVALFVAAFGAMTAVRPAPSRARVDRSQTIVQLVRPAPTPPTHQRSVIRPPPATPRRVPPTIPTQPPVDAPAVERGISAPTPVNPPPRDTARADKAAAPVADPSLTRIGPPPSSGTAASSSGSAAPAPITGVGVSIHSAPISNAVRDSILGAKLAHAPTTAGWYTPLTADEKSALRAHREPGIPATGRAARFPGEPVYAPLMNGGASVAIPAISIGLPKRDTRKRDSLDSEYQSRLRRLQDRIPGHRDSLRADSLRRDSLAHIARRP